METHQPRPRNELDLMTKQELASHLKICRRQLYNWRVGGLNPYFKMVEAADSSLKKWSKPIERI